MKYRFLIYCVIFLPLFIVECDGKTQFENRNSTNADSVITHSLINKEGSTILTRFNPPPGYERIHSDSGSFAEYLGDLPLKPFGSPVLYFNEQPKDKPDVYISVVDMKIGKRDLQQCADAVMRLRGEYLYNIKKYDDIHFNFLSDGKPRYYKDYNGGDTSYSKFLKYMDYIFSYANTSSLYDELVPVSSIDQIQTGDVLIQKGKPYGHAVTVVDVAVNKETGAKVYLLAQSYMPAQETQILVNPSNKDISPWYEAKEGTVYTPEWTFTSEDLRRFRE